MAEPLIGGQIARWHDRPALARLADRLVVAVVASLPWSTSATGVLIVLWLLVALPTIDLAALRGEVATWAGGLPVLLWVLGVLGMVWSDASLADRFGGLASFHRLLVIPLLLARFRRSDAGKPVLIGFLVSAVALLAASVLHALLWNRTGLHIGLQPGVPVKDYILQSGVFLICMFALLGIAADWWQARRLQALAAAALAFCFLADIAYVATGRTALVVIAVLTLVFGARRFGLKGLLGAVMAAAAVVAVLWASSPYLRERVNQLVEDFHLYESNQTLTSSGIRVEFWRKSLGFVAAAPLIGHGTGSINGLFRGAVTGHDQASAIASENPHQQMLAIAIQIGLVGVAVLLAMWLAHVALFRDPGLIAWIGLVVVVQNIVSSQFNSHLFDFSQGWLYVFGVGVVGGMVLRARPSGAATRTTLVRRDAVMMLPLPARPRILVVALRRLGDVLLTTPLIRSLRRAWPDATIETLVFAGTEDILAGNPDLDAVIAMPSRPTVAQSFALIRRLWRRYDLSVSTQTGDRPTFITWAAAPNRAGLVERRGAAARLKGLAVGRSVATDARLHRVDDVLRLADALGIGRTPEVVCPAGPVRSGVFPQRPYAVIHAAPLYAYKRWTAAGWQDLTAELVLRGLAIVATGGPAPEERRYLDEVWGPCGRPVRRIDGRLGWPELAALVAGARIYVGPDTSVTHLAAASGCPTVALYGPTDPSRWGPWPAGGLAAAWSPADTIQRRGNVWLVQAPLFCVPCQQEGCERRLGSYSRCLDELTLRQVLAAVADALAVPVA
ncbi:MAG TPA: glycosyltransferase family 9 protein [Xanthobacteraceae bacterium]|nr:glycosyltransferase family 9 protein [Xanthobacteraceae bacterium]